MNHSIPGFVEHPSSGRYANPAGACLALAIAFSIFVASGLLLASMSAEARGALPQYVRASLRASAPDSFRPSAGADERDELAALYHDRSASFLLSQWLV